MDEERSAVVGLELMGCVVKWTNHHVSSIYSMHGVGNSHLAQLRVFCELCDIDLQGSHVNNDGLVHLRDMLSLKRIHLGHTKVTAEGLQHLVALNKLAALDLTGTSVVIDDAVEFIKQLSGLTWLDLRMTPRTPSSAAALADLKRALPNLRFHPLGVAGLL